MNKTAAEKLIAFIDKSPSVYHVVYTMRWIFYKRTALSI